MNQNLFLNKKLTLHSSYIFCFSVLTIFFLFSLISCQQRKEIKNSEPPFLVFTDSYQRNITLTKEPQRIISLSPAITEMIFLLNQNEKLVGITNFCTYPQETEKITKIGDLLHLNIETLVNLNPDLILIGSIIEKSEIEKIEKMNIPVIAIKEENRVEGLTVALHSLGKILNADSIAAQEISSIKAKLNNIKENVRENKTKKKVYYVVGFGEAGDFTAPKNSHIDEIISLAGGVNIGHHLPTWNISREYLFQENPDLIFIRKEDYDSFVRTSPYNQLKAVKNHQVFPIESGWIDIVSTRNINAIEFIHFCMEENKATN